MDGHGSITDSSLLQLVIGGGTLYFSLLLHHKLPLKKVVLSEKMPSLEGPLKFHLLNFLLMFSAENDRYSIHDYWKVYSDHCVVISVECEVCPDVKMRSSYTEFVKDGSPGYTNVNNGRIFIRLPGGVCCLLIHFH